MRDIFLDLRRVEYISDKYVTVSAWRAYVDVLFITPSGARVSFSCILDPGAPFSVLPFSLWHDCNLQWTPLGQQLTRRGNQVPKPLEWQKVPCYLGDTSVYLMDLKTGVQAGPYLTVAKFVGQRLPQPNLETIALLGINFLTDNLLRLVGGGSGGGPGTVTCPFHGDLVPQRRRTANSHTSCMVAPLRMASLIAVLCTL